MIQDHHIPALYYLEHDHGHVHKYRFEGEPTVDNLVDFETKVLDRQVERCYLSQDKSTLVDLGGQIVAVNTAEMVEKLKNSKKFFLVYLFKEHSPYHKQVR